MAANDHFTTRATHRADHLPNETNKWTDRGDGFNVELSQKELAEELPWIGNIALGYRTSVVEHDSPKLKRHVAVKLVDSSGVNNGIRRNWKEEANNLRHLRHYHIVRALGSYTERNFCGIILEPVAPCNLKTYLWREKNDLEVIEEMEKNHEMDTSHLPRIMGCLAHALSYIHQERRVRHCDIKPENILLEGTRAIFADFGLSKIITETHSGSSGPSSKTPMVGCHMPETLYCTDHTSILHPSAQQLLIGTSQTTSSVSPVCSPRYTLCPRVAHAKNSCSTG